MKSGRKISVFLYIIAYILFISACVFLFFGKKDLSNIMQGKDAREGYNLDRAEYFLEKARVKFEDVFIGKKYLISAVSDLSSDEGYKRVCDMLLKLSYNNIKRILEEKSDEKIALIKSILQNLMEKN